MESMSAPTGDPNESKISKNKPGSFNTILVVALSTILLGSLIGNGFLYTQLQKISARTASDSQPIQTGFFDINDSRLEEYGEYYGFKTTLQGYNSTNNELLAEVKGPNPPKIIVSNKTLFLFFRPDGKVRNALLKDLAAGQEAYIIMSYDKKTKTWVTRNVSVLVNQFPEEIASPSAQNKQ